MFSLGPQCRMSILINGNVACLCRLLFPMSHVEFKKGLCHMSLYFLPPCRMSLSPMSHVEFKNYPVAMSILGVKGHQFPSHSLQGQCSVISSKFIPRGVIEGTMFP